MRSRFGNAAFLAAFFFAQPLHAEDVTLLSREGDLTLSGRLQSYDGEFYRIETSYGPLTVDGEGVICEGPACPDMIAPKAVLRLVGAAEPGRSLMPKLFQSFAKERGLIWQERVASEGAVWAAAILMPESQAILAEISFTAMPPDAADAAQQSGAADFVLSTQANAKEKPKTIAMDAIVPILAKSNPIGQIATPDLARALAGEVKNWRDLGGPDMPIMLHALAPETDLGRALAARLGVPIKAEIVHADMASLAEAVAKDPWALAMTARSAMGKAVAAPLTDSCGFPLRATPLAIKGEDYPLSLPLFLKPPPRRLPLLGREFLEFLTSPQAGALATEAGYIDRSIASHALADDGLRLIQALQTLGDDVALADVKRLAAVMNGATRLSLTFRYDDDTNAFDAQSQANLLHLAQLLESEMYPPRQLLFAGFSDGSRNAANARKDATTQAEAAVQELAKLLPALPAEKLPGSEGFGDALPMACDTTAIGRRLNRRVELWLVPQFTPEPL